MNRTTLNILVCAAVLAGGASVSLAQSSGGFHISLATIDGGGGTANGGIYSVSGSLGQPDAGAMSGGTFALSGGFWPAVATIPPGPLPTLAIRHGTGSTILLTWPNPSTGYGLQQTANMSGPGGGWVDVSQTPVINGANKEVTLQASGSFCMFRLRKP